MLRKLCGWLLSLREGLSDTNDVFACVHSADCAACFKSVSLLLLFSATFFYLCSCSSLTIESEEDYEDVTVNQMLAPKSQQTDATEILNNLLKEYDKKLRPDIGGKGYFCPISQLTNHRI